MLKNTVMLKNHYQHTKASFCAQNDRPYQLKMLQPFQRVTI